VPQRRRRKRARTAPPTGDALEQLLSSTDGLTTAALAEQADAGSDVVLATLKQLEASGRVRRTGQRRSTRWHLITDEDRIAARAAELQAQSRAA
jgi:hypothetical protein